MKKQIASFGEIISKSEQKEIHGGNVSFFGPNACHAQNNQTDCENIRNCVWYDTYCDGNVPHIIINP